MKNLSNMDSHGFTQDTAAKQYVLTGLTLNTKQKPISLVFGHYLILLLPGSIDIVKEQIHQSKMHQVA